MTTRKRQTHHEMLVSIMEALSAHGCITSYRIDGKDAYPEWAEGGFDRAFEEFKSNAKPFGLTRKAERAWLSIVLAQKNKGAVDDFLIGGIIPALSEYYGSTDSTPTDPRPGGGAGALGRKCNPLAVDPVPPAAIVAPQPRAGQGFNVSGRRSTS